MLDLHCHILPGIDDGPPTMDDTLDLARAHVAAGTSLVVATSHVSWDHPDNGARLLGPLVELVRTRLAAAAIPLEIRTGAEVALTRVEALDDPELQALRLGGGPWLLLECPFTPSSAGFDAVIDDLLARGHRLLLAHPERCPAFHREPERLEHYVRRGLLTSMTAGAFVGRFGSTVQEVATAFLRRGLVHSVASDAHDLTRRPPGIEEPLTRAGLDPQLVRWLGHDVPRAILDGTPVPSAPVPFDATPPRRGLRGRLRRAS